jgi:iron complex transport system permease protein
VTVELLRLPGRTAVRSGRASVVVRPRTLAVTSALLLLALVAGCTGVAIGEYVVPPLDVVRALLGQGEDGSQVVVRALRLPRVVAGLLVGTALGLSGALAQAVTRNPLASPDVLGVTAGASAGAVSVIVLKVAFPLPLAALAGGLLAAAVVVAAAGPRTGPRLVLVGIAVHYAALSITSYLLVKGDVTDAQKATVWLTGSLNGRGWEHAGPVALALLVLTPAALLLGRALATLRLGDDVARGLGVRVPVFRLGLLLSAVGLAAAATASAGPVLFVALVAPQIALRLTGGPGIPLLASAAAGAVLVVLADLVGRTVLPGIQLPVGAVTAALGAPVLLWLLRRASAGSTG